MSIFSLLRKLKNSLRGPEKQPSYPHVNIGKDSDIFYCELSPNSAVGNRCFLYKTSLGSYSYLSQHVSVMNTKIGKYCSIGQGCAISSGMHPSRTFVSTSPVFFSTIGQCGVTFADKSYFREMGETVIGNDVWIGANVVIKDDVVIGDGAIVGAGSVVTKDVPPYAIVVGSPARILRYRFTEEQIRFLLEFKWWDRDPSWVSEHFKDFHDIEGFIQKYKKD